MTSRLHTRLAAIASTWGAIALVGAGLIMGALNERAYLQSRNQGLQAQAEVLAATVEPALVFFDRSAAGELVGALGANPQIAAASVYNEAGELIAQFTRTGRERDSRPSNKPLTVRANADAVTAPVIHESRPIGLVLLRPTPEPAMALVQRHGGVALLLFTAVLLVLVAQRSRSSEVQAGREIARRAAELFQLNADLQDEIERRESVERALQQAQKMETLGQLTGGIAHDFNNLLQTVQGALDIISKQPSDLERVKRWSRIGLGAAGRGARLTAQLLAFSRAQKLEMRPVQVGSLVERLRELLPSAAGAGVTVTFQVADDGCPVLGDAVQLELAVLNLCINARDAMPNGGGITVATRSETITGDPELTDGRYLVLSVTDTGYGMPEDIRARAFDPFFTTKGVGKGTGLGLAQVYGIAKQSGGVARICSTAGVGTTVSIILPETNRLDATSDSSATAAASVPVSARVLVVDDDEGVRAFVCDVLQINGYKCVAVADGQAGLDRLGLEDFDLMIVDYAMPGITGAQVATAALAMRPTLPIVVSSGYAESSALESAMGRPVELLRKPFDSSTLLQRIAQSLDTRR